MLWIFVIILIIIVIIADAVGRLFPRKTGKNYFRKLLWKNEVNRRELPSACVAEFVDDALRFAKTSSSRQSTEDRPKTKFIVQFKRMLMIHAYVVAALIRGDKPENIKRADVLLELLAKIPLRFRALESVFIMEAFAACGNDWEKQFEILRRYDLVSPVFDPAVRHKFIQDMSALFTAQRIIAGKSIETNSGTINVKALGYMFGYIDFGLKRLGQDASNPTIGKPIVYEIIHLVFPGCEDRCIQYLTDFIGVDGSLTEAALAGHNDFVNHHNANRREEYPRSPMGFALALMGADNH